MNRICCLGCLEIDVFSMLIIGVILILVLIRMRFFCDEVFKIKFFVGVLIFIEFFFCSLLCK